MAIRGTVKKKTASICLGQTTSLKRFMETIRETGHIYKRMIENRAYTLINISMSNESYKQQSL